MIQCRPLQLTLPIGFDSWAQVLTDWRVSRAFDASPFPHCFTAEPELAAPFVAAISRAICERQLRHPPPDLIVLQECVVEPTYDRVGGSPYVALHDSMEAAQKCYFTGLNAHGRKRDLAVPLTLPAEVDRLQSAFSATRRRFASDVEKARRAVAQKYWTKHSRYGLDDSFFDDAPVDSIPARIARIDPGWWWRSFFTRLQARSKRHHAADGRLLDALPCLRAQARKKTLAAQIAEWSEVAAAEWGWRGAGHYRRLAEYADKKAGQTVAWFDHRAPGYLGTEATRHALDARLIEFFAEHDPHARLLAAERNRLSEHWRN